MTAEPDAAVAIVHAREPADSVLLMRRSERAEDSWSGHWSFPGGRRDARDPGPIHTAMRELEEECGIRLRADQLDRPLPLAMARRRAGRYLQVAPFVFRVQSECAAKLDPREAAEAVWVPLRVLCDPARHSLRPVHGPPPEALYPAIDLNGTPLWGFTYRLITDWLELNPRQGVEEAGFQVACALLDALIARGCGPAQDWQPQGRVKTAAVHGAIPVEWVRAQTWLEKTHIPRVNMLEVRPERIRMIGLAFEEYIIEAR
ncbi:MAG TPA: CoA pyrophosphatase [Bryobacteraceae bacterium]|nr:CoA pyrophosphatase [Bryobacteraceae bacterium]